MHKRKSSCLAIQLFIGCLLAVPKVLQAQDFYKDRIIRFIVGQAAGGGYDTYTRTVARHMNGYKVVVTKSTVPVGTGERLRRLIREHQTKFDFGIVSNPEFLRDGLEACRSRSHPGCRKIRQHFWTLMERIAADASASRG